MRRRTFLLGSAGAGIALLTSAGCASKQPATAAGAQEVTALTQVFGDGLKLTAVAVQYDRDVDTTKLTPSSFAVADRTVNRVYANTSAAVSPAGRNGRYVIIELSPDDAGALLWGTPQGGSPNGGGNNAAAGGPPAAGQAGPAPTIAAATASITQPAAVAMADGTSAPPITQARSTAKTINPIVDDFQQLQFIDPSTATTLDYNLFVPRDYDPAKRYPLVLFMHDASVVGAPPSGPIVQGLGAVAWASPDDQARHACFVIAPQYPTVVIDDTYQPTPSFDATVNLLHSLTQKYSIDTSRMYATGQSMGAMMTIGLNIKHPDLFAASYVVAGQWPTDQTGPLARKRLWITVSQGDTKAYPAQNEITALAENNGATVTRAVWNGQSTQEQFTADVSDMTTRGTAINYVALLKGTTSPAGTAQSAGASEHMGTWHVAYGIPGIRDWIMAQRL